jgi:acetoin utilization deacetylase AcuC-like enzyme
MLDSEYHHGNGQQQIFYKRSDVVTISLHGHPSFAYPYFSGFADERGLGAGKGCNFNIPLPEELEPEQYIQILERVLGRISRFRPHFLVVTLGLDTAREDPTGTWKMEAGDFETVGTMIGALRLPTLIVQEGGYDTRVRDSTPGTSLQDCGKARFTVRKYVNAIFPEVKNRAEYIGSIFITACAPRLSPQRRWYHARHR